MRTQQIQKTIKYASFFNTRLTPEDLHLWLISSKTCSFKKLSNLLSQHPQLQKKLVSKNNPARLKKIRLASKKIKNIQKLIFVLRLMPTIRLIALTGSLSVNNPNKHDDIDLMIITSPDTLWLTRPIVIFAASFFSKRRSPKNSTTANNQACLNLWIDQTSLTVPKSKQNLYIAHEVLQIKPLLNRGGVYHQFILANSWVKKHLANAYKQFSAQQTGIHRPPQPPAKAISFLNLIAFKLQYMYMKKKMTKEHVTPHAAYFHPRNLYPRIKTKLRL